MRELMMVGLLLAFAATWIRADLDVAALADAYRQLDMERNEGRGHSDAVDSGTLGWSQGGIMTAYANLWETTEDTYWLEKISEHFHRIMGNASDPEGDDYLSWYTTSFNTAVAWSERLRNVSDAEIGPDVQKIWAREEAAKATGHSYLVDFLESSEQFRILDWTTHEVIADGLQHDGNETEITEIEPFTLKLTGQTHQGDRFMVRTMAPEPSRYVVHQGLFLYGVACFIEAVKTRPELQEQFGDDADEFLEFINHHVFEKNERDWLDMGELGGAYRFEPKITDRHPNRIKPHNQYAEIARVWLVLKDVEGAHPLMADRAEQMVRYFHSHLDLDEQNDAYMWRYWDWILYGEPGTAGTAESTGYANIDVAFAVEAARRGVVFTDEDMARFANTMLRVMWNQDEENPLLASAVDGREPYRFAPWAAGFSQLSQWDPRVYELALTSFLARDEAGQASAAPSILVSAKRAGVELPGLVQER